MNINLNFPKILTENVVKEVDFNLDKLVSLIQRLEQTPLENFGAGTVKEHQERQFAQIKRSIKNYIVSCLVEAGFPLIPEEVLRLQRYYEVHFPKGSDPVLASTSMTTPEQEDYKEGNTYVRWTSGPYLVAQGLNSYGDAQIASLPYVGRRRTEVTLRAQVPSGITNSAFAKKQIFLSNLLKVYSDLLLIPAVEKYFNINRSYYGGDFNFNITEQIVWAPKEENIYISVRVIPEDRDPALVVTWSDCKFLIDFWEDNTDDENLKPILDEFIV